MVSQYMVDIEKTVEKINEEWNWQILLQLLKHDRCEECEDT